MQRCRDQEHMVVTRAQLVNWAARIVRLSYEDDAQDSMLSLAVEIKDTATVILRGKLVRDRIPEIIRQSGSTPIVEPATPENYPQYVRMKLQEELHEYLQSGEVAELADLIEVCFAAAALQDVSPTELVAVVRDKHGARGGFDDRLVWMGNA